MLMRNRTAVPKYVNVKAGDQLTFEWYHDTYVAQAIQTPVSE